MQTIKTIQALKKKSSIPGFEPVMLIYNTVDGVYYVSHVLNSNNYEDFECTDANIEEAVRVANVLDLHQVTLVEMVVPQVSQEFDEPFAGPTLADQLQDIFPMVEKFFDAIFKRRDLPTRESLAASVLPQLAGAGEDPQGAAILAVQFADELLARLKEEVPNGQ